MRLNCLVIVAMLLLGACSGDECRDLCLIETLILGDGSEREQFQQYADEWGVGIEVFASRSPGVNNIWLTDKLCSGVPEEYIPGSSRCPLVTLDAMGFCSPRNSSDIHSGEVNNAQLFIDRGVYDKWRGPLRKWGFNHEMGHCLGFIHTDEPGYVMSVRDVGWDMTPEEREVAQSVYLNGGGLSAALASGRMLFINKSDLRFTLVTH